MRRRGLQLPCYEGDKPFIYACYAGADGGRVRPFLRQLQERRFRLYYSVEADLDGAHAARMAARMQDASLILLFFSESANATAIWRYQVNFATDLKKQIICVRLDDSEPSKGMRLQFAGMDFFDAFRARDTDAFFPAFAKMAGVTQALVGDNVEGYPAGEEQKGLLQRAWFYVACTALLMLAALAIVLPPRLRALREAQQSGGPQIEYLAQIQFSEPLIQQAVVASLGKAETDTVFEDDLRSVTRLAVCGRSITDDADIVDYTVAAGLQRTYINGYQVASGDIQDIRELAMLTELRRLAVSGQAITDISPLRSLTQLTQLDISGNPIVDLAPLLELQALESLDISCTDATDFSALSSLPRLKTLSIRNMPDALDAAVQLPLQSLCVSDTALSGAIDRIAEMETLESLDISNTDVDSIEALTRLPNLRVLHAVNCAALTDWDALTRMPALTRVYLSGPTVRALPEATFRALIDRGVEIVL